jgi:hypothetical protein
MINVRVVMKKWIDRVFQGHAIGAFRNLRITLVCITGTLGSREGASLPWGKVMCSQKRRNKEKND